MVGRAVLRLRAPPPNPSEFPSGCFAIGEDERGGVSGGGRFHINLLQQFAIYGIIFA